MIERPFWLERVEKAWQETPIVWLAGVRRSGKTTLAQSLGSERATFVNCDLPAVGEMVSDPELFFRNATKSVVVFDEIHQLHDPSRLLKVAADRYPNLKILATGSSTLAATRKFKDTLTGRKRLVHLTPVLWEEISAFGATLLRRLHHGGLPEALLAEIKPMSFYREWMDSFFARDIQRLFAFRDPVKFNLLFEYVMKQSGGLFEVSRASSALGISRPTIENHLRALEATQAVTLIRPFHGGGRKELIKMPKVYAFDTGFVGFCRGWDPLRSDDLGPLWEHLVLEHLQSRGYPWRINFWRDSSGREIDFVIARSRDQIDAIECKWDPAHLDPAALCAFRSRYPGGTNYVICPLTVPAYTKRVSGMEVRFCPPDGYK